MAVQIGPWPVTEPLPTVSIAAAPPGFLFANIYRFFPSLGQWFRHTSAPLPWDLFPFGFYVTPGLANLTAPDNGSPDDFLILQVSSRVEPGGSIMPNVLVQPPPNPQSDNCPLGFWYDQGVSNYCALIGGQSAPKCPPGTHWDSTTETCVADPVPVIPICPPGTHWDTTTETCIADVNIPPPPPPTGQPDPDGDEITDDLCAQMAANTIAIVTAIQQLQQQQGQGSLSDPVTCKQLTGLIVALNFTFTDISDALIRMANKPATTVDLSAIVASLGALVTAANSYPPVWTAIGDLLGGKLDNIAQAVSTAPGTDTAGIVEQLKAIVNQGDVDQPIFDALQKAGFISADDLQVLQGIKWSDALAYIESTRAFRFVEKSLNTVGADASAIPSWLDMNVPPAANYAEQKLIGALQFEQGALQKAVTVILNQIKAAVKPTAATQVGVIGVNPDTVLADVAAVGINLEAVITVVAMVLPGLASQMNKWAELITALTGLEELREVQLGPLIQFGIARVAEMQAKATFKQEIPGTGALHGLVAQGLLDRTRARAIVQFNGTPDELEPLLQASAYRGLNPRQMLRLIETDIFTSDEIADELTFAGMRPVSQHRLLMAAPYLASASQRNALRSTLESAYQAGLLSDAGLAQRLNEAEQNTDRDSLSVSRSRLLKLIAESKALEAEYTALFEGGLMADDLFRANLAGLGLQPDMIDIIAGRAEAKANVSLRKKTLAAEAKLEAATEAAARKAAIEGFKTGTIDAAGLTAALLATGLTAAQVAAQVALAQLQLGGALQRVFGLELTPQAATLLRARVGALTDQRKRLLISDAQFVDSLTALNLPPATINALRAKADATITPKSSAVVIPVQTS